MLNGCDKGLGRISLILGLYSTWVVAQSSPIVADGTSFALNGRGTSYRFHVDNSTGDLVGDHFGGPSTEGTIMEEIEFVQGWVTRSSRIRRELPDQGTGDFRTPAIRIRQSAGHTVSDFRYQSHTLIDGKPGLPGLPATFGEPDEVSTIVVHMYDNVSHVAADLSYSIFPKLDAVVRSVNVTNWGNGTITLERLASLSIDLPGLDLDIVQLKGDWAREGNRVRRPVGFGIQGFTSSTGYSSHLHNPFVALVDSSTTESRGDAFGFALVYTGSFAVEVEKGSQGLTRTTIGLNPNQLSWSLKPGETFTSPECVAVFSDAGIGGMSRKLHRLYRKHLMKSKFAAKPRPVLLNSWEGLTFDINEETVYKIAQQSADLGVKLFVMDDGWFGNEHPRVDDTAGLGDWQYNKKRFPNGLPELIERVTNIEVANSSEKLQFGIWFEPEMVNPDSNLYEEHPDWVLHADGYARTETRSQLVLNVGLPEVQDFIIESVSNVLRSAPITYVKWDNNRGIHETPSPMAYHQYMLGIYRVFENLTTEFPDVLWEGCASGGGRVDPGILHWFPQIWASDQTDALERIAIQFGTSLAYPASAIGAHISHVPNGITGRVTPFGFRAHVALMGGSFGLELNPDDIDEDEAAQIPEIIALAERINPIIVQGNLWRLSLPEDTTHPSALFISEDGNEAVLFVFQTRATINNAWPWFRLQGLDASSRYIVNGTRTLSGATLMNVGVQLRFGGDLDSKVILLERET